MTIKPRQLVTPLLGALLLGATLLVLAGALAGSATATPAGDKARYDQVQQRLAEARAAIDAAKARESELGAQVAGFDSRLAVLNAALARIDARVAVVRKKLDKTRERLRELRRDLKRKTAELERTEAELQTQQRLFEQRVEAMYKKGDVSYFDVIIGSHGWEDLVSRIELVRTLASADNDLVGTLTDLRERVAAQKRRLAQDEADMAEAEEVLKAQSDKLAVLRAEAAAKQAGVAAARAAKNGVLQQVASNRAAWEQQEDELLAESQRLAAIISGSGGGGKGTGRMVWPVNGPVTSSFGWRIHPIFKVRKFHTGIDIAAGSGVPIVAADSGSVIFAGWMSGYGNVVVVDHGQGISTLCAHMSSIGVGNGSTIKRGQTIGAVGMTGYATGPHLHFEVRVGGNPVDPLGYLP